jgi:dihydrofolate synthase/folylpolyglutamate synthase
LHGPSPAQLEPLPAPQLTGDIQYRNAAMALTAWYALHEARPEAVPVPSVSTVHEGLSRVSLPGRMQVLARGAEWVLDVAHNVPAAEVFAAALRKRGPARRTIAIFGMLGDKDISGVVRVLDGLVDEWWLCPTVDGRGLDAAQLALRMGSTRGVRRHFASVEEASAQALTTGSADERVLVCGSFHVVGPALRCLEL